MLVENPVVEHVTETSVLSHTPVIVCASSGPACAVVETGMVMPIGDVKFCNRISTLQAVRLKLTTESFAETAA